MNIQPCIFDINNTLEAGVHTIGEWIYSQNKEHLWEERRGSVVDTVVIHFISAKDTNPADPYDIGAIFAILCSRGLSVHYIIDRQGIIRQLVPEDKKAWHAGGSIMPEPDGRRMANEFSIGIELVALPDSGFTSEEYESCAWLCADIEHRRGTMVYVGHDEIAGERAVSLGLRQDIKIDPGSRFDWGHFSKLKRHYQSHNDIPLAPEGEKL